MRMIQDMLDIIIKVFGHVFKIEFIKQLITKGR